MLKDLIVAQLRSVSTDRADPRRSEALYELGKCNFGSFGDPCELNEQQGLDCILQAAQEGNITAKGFANRLLKSFGSATNDLIPQQILKAWLEEAAIEGNEAAFEDLTANAAPEMRSYLVRRRLDRKYQSERPPRNLQEFKGLYSSGVLGPENPQQIEFLLNSDGDSLLHWAAQYGLLEHLSFLLDEAKWQINWPNYLGDSPFLSACRVGELSSSLFLFAHGADVNLMNYRLENALHFLWKFSDEDATTLLEALAHADIYFGQKANPEPIYKVEFLRPGKSVFTEIDPLPLLFSTPIDRVAARGRAYLVKKLLQVGPGVSTKSSDFRQLVNWSVMLNHNEVRRTLLEYRDEVYQQEASDLTSEGEQANLESEAKAERYMVAARGFVLTYGDQWKTPGTFWRRCCHGERWQQELETTLRWLLPSQDERWQQNISNILRGLPSSQGIDSEFMVPAISYCAQNGDPSFLATLR